MSESMRLISIDVESNGLHGAGFAVGAVVLDSSGAVLDRFEGRAPIEGPVDKWVEENVLPALSGMEVTFDTSADLRTAFWTWFQKAKSGAIVLADVGCPVETRFLAACIDDARDERAWGGPYPLHEVATLLLAAGFDPDVKREEFAAEMIAGREVCKHHPAWDAEVSGLCAVKALRALGRVS